MDKVRIGVIEVGTIGVLHATTLVSSPLAELGTGDPAIYVVLLSLARRRPHSRAWAAPRRAAR